MLSNKENYEVLAEFPFDSTRKRMSLVVKRGDQYFVLCKGADNIMMPRLVIGTSEKKLLEDQLYKFACDGLRTLVMSKKEITANEYEAFAKEFHKLKTTASQDKERNLGYLYDAMEQNLDILGCSAIEDKLQEGVAETIERLMQANIRVWVLTGDKQETAIEIGKSCRLIQPSMKEVILSSESKSRFVSKLNSAVRHHKKDEQMTIIIDGPTLALVLESEDLSHQFFGFGLHANSVICCRVSPKQKADVVGLAKRWTE